MEGPKGPPLVYPHKGRLKMPDFSESAIGPLRRGGGVRRDVKRGGREGARERVPQTAPGPPLRTAPALCNEFWRRPTLPRVPPVVPSALEGLTAGFGMDPGVSPPLWPPETWFAIHRFRGDHKRKMRLRPRHISTGQLNDSRRLHPRPINPVVSRMPYLASQWGISSRGRLPA